MEYGRVVEGVFLRRPNRFVAYCMTEGQEVKCHVPNTGRCRELLIPDRRVYLAVSDNPNRATRYSLVAVDKDGLLVNMDSGAPNRVVEESILRLDLPGMGPLAGYRREARFHQSRFDFFLWDKTGKEAYLEVKGVTLFEGRAARFPDAPTQRGIRHIHELIEAREMGYNAYLLFVVQAQGLGYVAPNDPGGTEFGDALRLGAARGVVPLAYDCTVTPQGMWLREPLSVCLKEDSDT
jgi:sugar fermentation stimulation protein A